ncbi:hypothetical protein BSFA1_85990 (plasmid) [Burkholderia sp. SFA1]|nr:hypothetical protein BSFA1_85990 [Burkholderia sp. SFA1]
MLANARLFVIAKVGERIFEDFCCLDVKVDAGIIERFTGRHTATFCRVAQNIDRRA